MKSLCNVVDVYLGCQIGINNVFLTCGSGPDGFEVLVGPTERESCHNLDLRAIPA